MRQLSPTDRPSQSSQVYTNARDLARFGLLYLQGGMWDGERLLSQDGITFVRTPAPATAAGGKEYGGHLDIARAVLSPVGAAL